jgi:hypothetical protein
MGTRAAILIQRGVPTDKQTEALLRYVLGERWSMLAIVPWWQPADAVTLVRTGEVDTVVCAFDSKAVRQLAADIGATGTVMVIHPEPKVVEPPRGRLGTVADLVLRWWRNGKTVGEIALDVGSDTTDIREVLRRAGEDPGRTT